MIIERLISDILSSLNKVVSNSILHKGSVVIKIHYIATINAPTQTLIKIRLLIADLYSAITSNKTNTLEIH